MRKTVRIHATVCLAAIAALAGLLGGCSSRLREVALSDANTGSWEMFRGNAGGTAEDSISVADVDTVLWKKKLGGRSYASPVIVGGLGILPALDKRTYVFDSETGEVLGKIKSRAPLISTPAMIGNLVYLAAEKADGRLRCVNIANKKSVWELKLKDISAPVVATENDVYVGNTAGVFFSVNRFTGEVSWKDSLGGTIVGGAAVSEGLVYVGSSAGLVKCFRQSGDLVWKHKVGVAVLSSPSVSDYCYVTLFDGRLVALDKLSGAEMWNFATGGSALGSPVADGDAIYFGSNDRSFYAVSERDGSLIWKKDLGGICSLTPLVASDEIAVGTRDGRVIFLDKMTGEERLVLRLKGRILSSPVAVNGRIYVSTADRYLYCLGSSATSDTASAISAASLSK